MIALRIQDYLHLDHGTTLDAGLMAPASIMIGNIVRPSNTYLPYPIWSQILPGALYTSEEDVTTAEHQIITFPVCSNSLKQSLHQHWFGEVNSSEVCKVPYDY